MGSIPIPGIFSPYIIGIGIGTITILNLILILLSQQESKTETPTANTGEAIMEGESLFTPL